jgi:NitT/TauT family transport system substrate-binding protein
MTAVLKCQSAARGAKPAMLLLATFICAQGLPLAAAAEPKFGKSGDPIDITIGYQPYFTESWSALVLRGLKLDQKYLPRGSRVNYQVGLTGAGVLLEELQADRVQMAYLGLTPTVTGASQIGRPDLRIVAVVGESDDQCNQILVPLSAPVFDRADQAIAWLAGKRLSVARDTCADLFVSMLLKEHGIRPAQLYNQSIDVLATALRTGAIDAAATWEPVASQLVDAGVARRLLSRSSTSAHDASFLVVRAQLLEQRPDVVEAWLRAELEAQRFMADARNAATVVSMVQSQTTQYSAAVLREALYKSASASDTASALRVDFPFLLDAHAVAILDGAAAFLHDSGRLDSSALPKSSIAADAARKVMDSAGTRAGSRQVP